MKTALEELIEDLSNNMVISIFERLEREGMFIKALEKEKEQIIAAMNYSTYREMKGINISNEEYYNQTYNKPLENK